MPINEGFSCLDIENAMKAIQYIESNYKHSISTDGLADKFHMNKKKLQLHVQLLTGFTIHDYQIHLRIEQIKTELSDPFQEIKKIARTHGFRSVTNFHRIFKKKTGLTPLEYRKAAEPVAYP